MNTITFNENRPKPHRDFIPNENLRFIDFPLVQSPYRVCGFFRCAKIEKSNFPDVKFERRSAKYDIKFHDVHRPDVKMSDVAMSIGIIGR